MSTPVVSPAATVAPDDATAQWSRCPRCHELIYQRRLVRGLWVCPSCELHHRLSATDRLAMLLDPDSAESLPAPPVVDDPLAFVDRVPYRDRVDQARAQTGLDEAVQVVIGAIGGRGVVVAAMDFRFLGGSLGCAAGARLDQAARTALDRSVPLIVVAASGGARMQEGPLALMQMAKTSLALAELDEAGLLTISVLTDPTFGGVAASFATLSDVILAEPGAHIGFAGPRVIEQTIRERLPDGFQSAESHLARGLVDEVVPRGALRSVLGRLLAVTRPAELEPEPADGDPVIRAAEHLTRHDPWQVVQLARSAGRPTCLDYAAGMLDEFVELHGDRVSGDCPAVVGGLGRLAGRPVVLIGHQKGQDTAERVARNFGMPVPAGYRKAARLMRLATKFGFPVITLVDTPGAYPGASAEDRGQAWAIAVADEVFALEYATYSVISPEGCAAILWKDQSAARQAASALAMDARNLLAQRVIDAVVPEPPGGAHQDPTRTVAAVRAAVDAALRRLVPLPATTLVAKRRERYRAFGVSTV
ncbi:MAG TPA: acetyl-CoA carboxylase carboxyltransferase subunit alpha/beta [Micromonosporaceae bacterium]